MDGLQKSYEDTNKEVVQIFMVILLIIMGIFLFWYYVITASVVGSIAMTILATLLIVRSMIQFVRIISYIVESSDTYKLNYIDKITQFMGVGYLIAFFVLLFI